MKKEKTSRKPGFHKLNQEEKIKIIKGFAGLTSREVRIMRRGLLKDEIRDRISENTLGIFSLPYSVAANFLINRKDYFVPMVTEEFSVVAAASHGAKMTRERGGIEAEILEDLMIGQMYFVELSDPVVAKKKIRESKKRILKFSNRQDPALLKAGGGVRDLEVKVFSDPKTDSLIRVHLLIDTQDAMGANAVNKIVEKTALFIERKVISGKSLLKIVSNLATRRLVQAKAVVTKKSLGRGARDTIERIVRAQAIAEADPYRAVTHNKGILNGIGALALATGNDWRALEAAVHGFAAQKGKYKPLTSWKRDRDGNLRGEIKIPVTVGTVGGITRIHPLAKISLKILRLDSACELAQVMAAVGLAQNLAALKALVTEGISKGHNRIRAENVARAAGAEGKEIGQIAEQMKKEKDISLKKARELIKK